MLMKNNNSIKISIESLKFFIVGGWNTLFGLGLYSTLVLILGQSHYLLLGLLCNVISITQAYLLYKFFVFKTKGNMIAEYLKCYTVYGTSMFLGFILMYVFVDILKIPALYSNFIVTGLLTIVSYLGHRNFTFVNKK